MDRSHHSKEIVIPKDKAVFWMDGAGRWHNQHGLFQHKKIIDHFNASIQKDENGYYLTQQSDNIIEKVYFHHAETALFAVDVAFGDPPKMRLNTGIELTIVPTALFICGDDLFYRMENQLVKFNQLALLKVSEKMTFHQGRCILKMQAESIAIKKRKSLPSLQQGPFMDTNKE